MRDRERQDSNGMLKQISRTKFTSKLCRSIEKVFTFKMILLLFNVLDGSKRRRQEKNVAEGMKLPQ